jgi:hypothetical protein
MLKTPCVISFKNKLLKKEAVMYFIIKELATCIGDMMRFSITTSTYVKKCDNNHIKKTNMNKNEIPLKR